MKQFDHNIHEDLLIKFLFGETDEQETLFVSNALESDSALQNTLKELKHVLDMVELSRIDENKAWEKFNTKIATAPKKLELFPKKKTFSLKNLAYAASVLIIIGLSTFFGLNLYNSAEIFAASTDEPISVELKDGSSVLLGRNSEIKYPRKFASQNRTVKLKGEAFFDIQHNPDKPFVVETADLTVTVLGTSFFVSAVPGQLPSVLVETGKVRCYYAPEDLTIELQAGETAVFGQQQTEVKQADSKDRNEFAWKTYNLRFENEPMEEIVRLINKAYGSNILLQGPIGNCRLTVNFNSLNVDGVLNVLQSLMDIQYTKSKGKITLTGEGC
jgi:transmembrane sensor